MSAIMREVANTGGNESSAESASASAVSPCATTRLASAESPFWITPPSYQSSPAGEQPERGREHRADHETARDRQVDPEPGPLDPDVPWETTERQRRKRMDHETQGQAGDSNDDQRARERSHVRR